MNKLAAIEKVVRGNIELFTLGEDINDWDFNEKKSLDLVFIGEEIFGLLGLSDDELDDELKGPMGNRKDAAYWTFALTMADDINQCVHDTLNDEATRRNL